MFAVSILLNLGAWAVYMYKVTTEFIAAKAVAKDQSLVYHCLGLGPVMRLLATDSDQPLHRRDIEYIAVCLSSQRWLAICKLFLTFICALPTLSYLSYVASLPIDSEERARLGSDISTVFADSISINKSLAWTSGVIAVISLYCIIGPLRELNINVTRIEEKPESEEDAERRAAYQSRLVRLRDALGRMLSEEEEKERSNMKVIAVERDRSR